MSNKTAVFLFAVTLGFLIMSVLILIQVYQDSAVAYKAIYADGSGQVVQGIGVQPNLDVNDINRTWPEYVVTKKVYIPLLKKDLELTSRPFLLTENMEGEYGRRDIYKLKK